MSLGKKVSLKSSIHLVMDNENSLRFLQERRLISYFLRAFGARAAFLGAFDASCCRSRRLRRLVPPFSAPSGSVCSALRSAMIEIEGLVPANAEKQTLADWAHSLLESYSSCIESYSPSIEVDALKTLLRSSSKFDFADACWTFGLLKTHNP